jgi:hypothetical protein
MEFGWHTDTGHTRLDAIWDVVITLVIIIGVGVLIGYNI